MISLPWSHALVPMHQLYCSAFPMLSLLMVCGLPSSAFATVTLLPRSATTPLLLFAVIVPPRSMIMPWLACNPLPVFLRIIQFTSSPDARYDVRSPSSA